MMQIKEPLVHSEVIAVLRPMFEEDGIFRALGQIFKLNLIVDANVLIADLRWLVSKRKKANARTKLFELIKCETIKVFAPTFLLEEIHSKLPVIAAKENLPLEELEAHWKKYKAHISFIDVGGPEEGYQDPNDIPYLRLQAKLDTLILSNDSDINQMGGRVAGITLVANLCTYSREAAIEYTLKVAGASLVTIPASMLHNLIKFLLPHFRRIPLCIWLMSVLLIITALVYPKTRAWILGTLQILQLQSKKLGITFVEVLEPLFLEHEQAKRIGQKALSEAKSEIAV